MTFIDFRKKLATDKEFAAKFVECKTPEDLVEAAAKEGYEFTVEDINENTELLPEELEQAAGGWYTGPKDWSIIPGSYYYIIPTDSPYYITPN